MIGNLTGKRLLNRLNLNQAFQQGYVIFTIGGFLLFIAGLLNLPLYMMVVAVSIMTFGNGFLIPLGTAGVISSFSKSTGYASGLLGCLQLGSAGFSAFLVGALSHNSVLNMGIYIFAVNVFGFELFRIFKRT